MSSGPGRSAAATGGGLLVTNVRMAAADGVHAPGWLTTDGPRIHRIGSGEPERALAQRREVIDGGGAILLPGFVDVHVHGAVGCEAMDADVDALARMARFFARHGVTAFLPTTWTAGRDETLAALRAVARARGERTGGARILGAHMEGPYLNPRRCGAQDGDAIRHGDLAEARAFLDTGVVRLVTLAPEMSGNLDVAAECARRGVTVSAGHTDATYDQVVAAQRHGVRHVTHTFNAMRPLHHREPGTVGAAMATDELTTELIADNVHVHPAAMRVLAAVKGVERLVLVTDAMRAAGMADGDYAIGERAVQVRDGAVRLPDGSLAGSVLTMDVALRNLAAATGMPPERLWPAASRNAAAVAGARGRKGAIVPGLDADLALVDAGGRVLLTVVEGEIVHRKDAEATTAAEHVPMPDAIGRQPAPDRRAHTTQLIDE